MWQKRSFLPPHPVPPAPGDKPGGIDQVDNFKADYDWGSLKKLEPRPYGGIPMQSDFWGRRNDPRRDDS